MDPFESERYSRHLNLPGFGSAGQLALQQAAVLVIGAGGLGCPVLQYLTASGVGTIGLVDNDVVALSNISRQVLYSKADIGKPKVQVAIAKLQAMNSKTKFIAHEEFLSQKNALNIISGYGLVIDCTDNFETRYLINDACVLLSKTFIHGAVYRFTGQTAVMNHGQENEMRTATYRCLFPEPPAAGAVGNCETAGVLGTLTGVIGTMQATLAVKVICGTGSDVAGKLFLFNANSFEMHSSFIPRNVEADKKRPSGKEAFLEYDYQRFCNSKSAPEFEISPAVLFNMMASQQPVEVIDIRQPGEWPEINDFAVTAVPITEFNDSISLPENNTAVVLICASGQRSLHLATRINQKRTNPVLSLRGGINAWNQFKTGITNE